MYQFISRACNGTVNCQCYQFQDLCFRAAVVAMITFTPNEISEPSLNLSLTASKYGVFICT